MGQPLMAFLQDELKMTRNKAAITLGITVFVLVQPVIFLLPHRMNEFDFWAGNSTPPSPEAGWWKMARLTMVTMLVALWALVAYTWRKHGGTGRETDVNEGAA